MLPFALEQPTFAFPSLAALAGRLPVGAGREVALAALLAARLAAELTQKTTPLPIAVRTARAAAAVHWLGATCPDARVRTACCAVAEASGGGNGLAAAKALGRVIEVTAPSLDGASRAELVSLIKRLDA